MWNRNLLLFPSIHSTVFCFTASIRTHPAQIARYVLIQNWLKGPYLLPRISFLYQEYNIIRIHTFARVKRNACLMGEEYNNYHL